MFSILSRMAAWSIPAAVLFFLWRAIIPVKIGVFFMGSATMSLFMTGALVLLPAYEGHPLEEIWVRTSLTAGTNFLLAVILSLLFFGIGLFFYIAGLSDTDNAVFFLIVLTGVLTFCFLFFWPSLAAGYFLRWPADVYSMYNAWHVWHLFPGLVQAFRVATNGRIFVSYGIAGSLCGMAQWISLFYVCGLFHKGDTFPGLLPSLAVFFSVFPAVSAALLLLSYHAFSWVLPQRILHPQGQSRIHGCGEKTNDNALEAEAAEKRRSLPILVAYQNRLGVELHPSDPEKPLYLFKGDSRTSLGTKLSVTEALGDQWVDHLNHSGAQWLIPILEDLAQGKHLDGQRIEKIKRESLRRLKQVLL